MVRIKTPSIAPSQPSPPEPAAPSPSGRLRDVSTISELESLRQVPDGEKKHIGGEEAELVTTEEGRRVRRCLASPLRLRGHKHVAQRLERVGEVANARKGAR